MTEPQVWTLIGVFAAALFGMLTLMSTMFVRVVRTEVAAVRTEIRRLDQRFDALDRDVQALTRRVFGADQA